ncbi:hypothetical protein D3C76_1543530 [compost metagenome]
MSLLSGLLDHMPPTNSSAAKPTMVNCTTDRPCVVLVERPTHLPTSTYTNTATPEWRNARDQYLNHVMACQRCYAPTARHYTAGTDLRAAYDRTPMESPR